MREEAMIDLLVIGAGPAGMAAALTASRHGLRVRVVDEQHAPGGQIFRQPPGEFQAGPPASLASYPFATPLFEAIAQDTSIDWRFGTTVWGLFRDADTATIQVGTAHEEQGALWSARKILIATGAYDLPVAFPGWTLPGVMAAGGVQTLLKSQFLQPGRRFVLAGAHPLLLLLAGQLLDAGAQIAELAFAQRISSPAHLLSAFQAGMANPRLARQGAAIIARLVRAGVPVRGGRMIRRAEGAGQLERVVLGAVDAQWRPVGGDDSTVEADVLAVGYGLLASTELARQAGCAVAWDARAGGWIVRHEPSSMQTSVHDIYVAGEPAGVEGAEAAYLQGQIAAHHAARVLAAPAQAALAPLENPAVLEGQLEKVRRFTQPLAKLAAPRLDALAKLPDAETIVCRCEEVVAGEVQDFLRHNPHVSDINAVKLGCRAGMGLCQGRYCQHTVMHMVAAHCGRAVDQVGIHAAQTPVKPVSVQALAGMRPD